MKLEIFLLSCDKYISKHNTNINSYYTETGEHLHFKRYHPTQNISRPALGSTLPYIKQVFH